MKLSITLARRKGILRLIARGHATQLDDGRRHPARMCISSSSPPPRFSIGINLGRKYEN